MRSALIGVGLVLLLLDYARAADTILVTGTVASISSQYLLAPMTGNFQAQISFMADEGDAIAVGDVVVRFNGTEVNTRIRTAEEALIKLKATTIKDLANLELKLLDARFKLDSAGIDKQLAQMKAAVSIDHIARLDYDENQLQLKRAEHALEEAITKLANAEQTLAEKRNETALALDRSLDKIRRGKRMLGRMTIVAKQPGFMIYGHHPWMRNKFQVGDSVQTSWEVGRISNGADLRIEAWVNAIDIPRISNGSKAKLYFDAIAGQQLAGELMKIAPAGATKVEWGDGLYHRTVLKIDDNDATLRPGMSVLVEIPATDLPVLPPPATP